MHDFFRLCRIGVDEFELASQVIGVTDFKKDEISFCEIIADTARPRRYHRFAERQTLKNPRWSIDVRENATAVWNNSYIALFDNGGYVRAVFDAEDQAVDPVHPERIAVGDDRRILAPRGA